MAYPCMLWSSVADAYRRLQVVGSPAEVRARIESLAADTGADEVMVTTVVHDHAARRRSYALLAEAFKLATAK